MREGEEGDSIQWRIVLVQSFLLFLLSVFPSLTSPGTISDRVVDNFLGFTKLWFYFDYYEGY